MVLGGLGSSLRNVLSKVAQSLFVDESTINELIRELQRALLQADVNTRQVLDLTKKIKERALKEQPPRGVTKKEHLINIVYGELVAIVGGGKQELVFDKKPTVLLMVGLFGSGKTTNSGKIAKYYAKRGKKVALVGLDTYRPAAMKQLAQLGAAIHVPVFIDEHEKSAVAVYEKFRDKLSEFDLVIVDSSGRDALNDDLITEIKDITTAVQPSHTWLVISGDLGQAAKDQATAFKEACGVSGLVVTKLDGTAKGGGALTAASVTGAPIYFIGVGEKVDDIEAFNPEGFIGRLLGMGDISLLLEKVQDAMSAEQVQDIESRILKGDFHLLDLYQQMEAMSKMGSFGKILEMIPGMGSLKLPQDAIKVQEQKLVYWKHAMNSMTKNELEDPEVITADRITRISKGSGVGEPEIRELIKQYRQARKMVRMMKGGDMQDPTKLMQKMSKGQMRFKGR